MIINMTTFAGREKHYIGRTLESLFASDGRDIPLNLILGSSDTSHVEQYREVANFVLWDEKAEAQAREGNRRHNCTVNAIRALDYGDDDFCLSCEDDISFKPNWYSELMLTVEQIPGKKYVLNLGQGSDPSPGKRYATHTRKYLCGAQAIFYPSRPVRRAVAEYLQEKINNGLSDALIGTYAKKYAALYNTVPTLVGHIGQTSSFRKPRPSIEATTEEVGARRAEKKEAPRPRVLASRPAPRARPAPPATVPRAARPPVSARAASDVLLALLRVSLGAGPFPDTPLIEQCDWQHLRGLATHHRLGPILYRALEGADAAERWRQKFKAVYVGNAVRNQLLQECVDEIAAAFSAERIPVILMRGAALQRTLYDDPGLRVMSNVDLLVDEGRDADRAGALLCHMGLTLPDSDRAEQRRPLRRTYRGYYRPEPQSIGVDLHWRLSEPYQAYAIDLAQVRVQATQLPGLPPDVRVMASEHELAHLCMQLDRRAVTLRSLVRRQDWRELLLLPEGCGSLLWLYDIALYVQRRGALIDWDAFVGTARRWGIDGSVSAALELSRRALGVAPPPGIFQALQCTPPRFVERAAHRALLASHRPGTLPKDASAASAPPPPWLGRLSGHVLRFARAWDLIFPPDAYLRARYAAPDASLRLRGRHLRGVVPLLWAEARHRMRAAGTTRRYRSAR